ncbi:MAG: 2Fe-2S iron-sulfur cluster-binding protein [Desulfoprunum sp.]|nr:2Fe-2S iron-sulfur cluster-binding protein [Desulfoprunum sp.]
MDTCKVTFLPHNREIAVSPGESLIRTALGAGVHVNASCGGEGVCGKCRVLIEDGRVLDGVSERLSKEDVEKGFRLACLARVIEDVTVRIPVESSIDTSVLNKLGAPRRTATIKHMDFNSLKEQGLFIPPVEKIFLELSPPDAQNNMPDVTRLVEYLKLKADEHKLELTMSVIRKLPATLRENDFKVTVTLVRPVRDDGKTLITDVQAGDTTSQSYAIAMDIGTTTVYGQLIDLASGDCLGEYGDFNGQISYGEDVISRIMFAEKPEGRKKLQEVVVATLNKVIKEIIGQAKVGRENIATITLAGNTTMTPALA